MSVPTKYTTKHAQVIDGTIKSTSEHLGSVELHISKLAAVNGKLEFGPNLSSVSTEWCEHSTS